MVSGWGLLAVASEFEMGLLTVTPHKVKRVSCAERVEGRSSETSSPARGSVQPPIRGLLGLSCRGLKVTTRFHLMSWLRMVGVTPLIPMHAFMEWTGKTSFTQRRPFMVFGTYERWYCILYVWEVDPFMFSSCKWWNCVILPPVWGGTYVILGT
jgi:hypothetical protein